MLEFIKKNFLASEKCVITSAIAETEDERCIKITRTLITLSRLRDAEHPPEVLSVHPYTL